MGNTKSSFEIIDHEFLKDEQKSFQRKNPTFTKELRKICEDWIKDDGSPFDMILARDGNILFHDAFGEDDYGKFTINTPSEIASITKLFTGILFAQFVDQNIIGIDDPVGKYLSDFPSEGPQAITLRHCFTHTSGLDGHGLFNGVHNPWLENTLFQTIKNKTAKVKLPSNANFIELIPRQTPIRVNTLGRMYLVLFTDTTLNLFFFSIYKLAIKLSPAITFCPTLTIVFLWV